MKAVLTICLSPTFQKTLHFDSFKEGEVNRASFVSETVAGKGINVSRTVQALGRPSMNLCQIGGCRLGEFLSYLKREDIDIGYIEVESEIRTCTTLIDRQRGVITELVENAREVDKSASERFFKLFLEKIDAYEAVVISGTKAKGFSSSLYPEIVREAKRRGKLVIIDIKGDELMNCLEEGPDIIKPNLSEFASTFLSDTVIYEGIEDVSIYDKVEAICADIFRKYKARTVLTRGKYDTWVYDGKSLETIPAIKNDETIINTVGCGDTLTGAMIHSLLNGDDLKTSVRFGMECALKRATGHAICR
ncbi:MAG: carbohydrate kinase [Spirochaetales bacterium]|nr:carbohydrate kinase [Spirochaetales bacterium]